MTTPTTANSANNSREHILDTYVDLLDCFGRTRCNLDVATAAKVSKGGYHQEVAP